MLWFRIFLSHPIKTFLFVLGAIDCLDFCRKHLPGHSSDGVENALRHALWIGYIFNALRKYYTASTALEFALVMTDMHEEVFPSPELQRKMDLHNNHIGIQTIQYLEETEGFSLDNYISKILAKEKNAVLISSSEMIKAGQLVYLTP